MKNQIKEFKEFKELKKLFVERCKNNSACETEFKKVLASKNKKQILQIIKDNINWCYRETNTVTIEVLEWFGSELCTELGIYYNGTFETKDNYCIALDNSTVEAWGNSTVIALDNSTVEAWGNSTVEAWGNSTVKALDNSTVEAWGNSTVEAWGNSTVKALDNSTVEALDNSTVEAWDNSTVKAWGNSTVKITDNWNAGKTENIKLEGDLSHLINIKERKIYVKKSKFEIVEI